MIGVVRILALLVGVVVAGCQTDGLVGPEASGAAKQRVIDTPKTAPRPTVSKKDSGAVAQGDVSARSAAASDDRAIARPVQTAAASPGTSAPAGGDIAPIPAQTLFGNWTLVDNSGRKCRLILGGVLVGAAYSARGEADCPHAFTTVQSWEIQGPELILRNQSRGVVGRLQPTGPARFDGQAEGGAVYIIR
jgi:Protease inhibitor Inh